MIPKVFLGIDLGKGGALHITGEGVDSYSLVMPLDQFGELEIHTLKIYLETVMKNHSLSGQVVVIFEFLTPLHKASKSSNWSLAFQAGAVEALCRAMGITYAKILPKTWQTDLLSSIAPLRKKDGTIDTKARALLKAKELYPDLILTDPDKKRATVPHDGIVDAILLAEWGRRNIK